MIRSPILFAAAASLIGLGSLVGITTKARSQSRIPQEYVTVAKCLRSTGPATVPKEGTPGLDICPSGFKLGCSANWTLVIDGSGRTDVCVLPLSSPGGDGTLPAGTGAVAPVPAGGGSPGVPAGSPSNAPRLVGYTCQAGYTLLIESNYLTCKRTTSPADYQAPILR